MFISILDTSVFSLSVSKSLLFISILDTSIFSISVLRSFFPYLYYMALSLNHFWVESLYGYPYSYPYYMVSSLSHFWVESLCSYPYVPDQAGTLAQVGNSPNLCMMFTPRPTT